METTTVSLKIPNRHTVELPGDISLPVSFVYYLGARALYAADAYADAFLAAYGLAVVENHGQLVAVNRVLEEKGS